MVTHGTVAGRRARCCRMRLAKALHRWVDVYVAPPPLPPPASVREAKRLARAKRRLAARMDAVLRRHLAKPDEPDERHD